MQAGRRVSKHSLALAMFMMMEPNHQEASQYSWARTTAAQK